MKMNKLNIFILISSTILSSCKVKKNNHNRNTSDIGLFLITIKPGMFTDKWGDNQTKQIKVIEYLTSPCKCGSRMCASNILGITSQNDTIRIFAICDTLTNIEFGNVLVINKQDIPKTEFSINSLTKELGRNFPIYFGKSK